MSAGRAAGERGVVLPLVAIVIGVLITFTAIAVDLGFQRVARRDVQAIADVVALDAVRRLDGQDVTTLDPVVDAAAAASVLRNPAGVGEAPGTCTSPAAPVGVTCLDVRLGEVDVAGDFVELFGTDVPTAVHVSVSTKVSYRFRAGSGSASRSAVATQESQANFMLGSFLVGVDLDTSLLNRVLPRFLGSPLDSLNISAVGWQGLANATMNIGSLATALGVASPNELADLGVVNARGVYVAAAQVMQAQGDTASAAIFDTLAATVDTNATMDLGDIWVEQGGSSGQLAGGTNLSMPAQSFLTSSVFAVNGTNVVTVPNFALGIAGILDTTLTLEVGEAPQYCQPPGQMCSLGASVSTAQVRARLENTLNVGLPLLGVGLLTGTITTETEGAGATGTLTAVRCSATGGVPAGIDVSVTTQPLTTTASENLNVAVTLPILGTLDVATIDVTNSVTLASGTGGLARFDFPNEFLPTVGPAGTKRVGSPDLGLSTSLAANGSNVSVLGVPGFDLGLVATAVNAVLSPALTSINDFLVRRLARTLGIDLGGADVGAVDLGCSEPLLVG